MNKFEKKVLTLLVERDNKYQEFFFKNKLLGVLCMTVSAGDKITFEEVCERVPRVVGSRSSVLIALREGVELGIFDKSQSSEDKRKREYSLSEGFGEWYGDMIEEVS